MSDVGSARALRWTCMIFKVASHFPLQLKIHTQSPLLARARALISSHSLINDSINIAGFCKMVNGFFVYRLIDRDQSSHFG